MCALMVQAEFRSRSDLFHQLGKPCAIRHLLDAKNHLNENLRNDYQIFNKNVTQNFLVYSGHSWGRRRFDVCRQTSRKFQKFRKIFFSKKIFFRLEKQFKVVSALKSRKKIFFGSNRPSGFCVLKISPLLNDLEISIN